MKATKKILAALFAVMMIVMMIPFSASAAETYSYDITGKDGYTFTVYKVADIDPVTMAVSNAKNTAIENAAKEGKTADLLAECNKLTNLTGGTTTLSNSNAAAGVYFVKLTGSKQGETVTAVQNSVFALPYYNDGVRTTTISFDAGSKVETDAPSLTKKFTEFPTVNSITEYTDTPISYTISGSTKVGTSAMPASSYVFTDIMTEGLDFVEIQSVKLSDGTDLKYTKSYANHVLTVTVDPSELTKAAFYASTSVDVVYTAKLNDKAITKTTVVSNENTVDLVWTDFYGNNPSLHAGPLKVFTYEVNVYKVDPQGNLIKKEAKFELKNGSWSKEVATVNGVATFSGIKAGTYTLTETVAPEGFAKNQKTYQVVVGDNGNVTSDIKVEGTTNTVQIVNNPVIVPETGGEGTMIFTIVGLSLIACAGVLFVVVRKRNSAK